MELVKRSIDFVLFPEFTYSIFIFSCEFCEIYESTYFERLRAAAPVFNEFLQHVPGEQIS